MGGRVTVAEEESLTDMVWANAERFADAVAFRHRVDGSWLDVTAADFAAATLAVARGLIAAGVGAGDHVVLAARTSYEWTLIDFAVWTAGAVTVAVDPERVDEAVKEWDAAAAIAQTAVDGVRSWAIGDAVAELTALGADVADQTAHERRLAVRASDVATVVSGVRLSHRALLAQVRSAIRAFGDLLRPANATLLFLPLTGVFGRTVALASVYSRTTLGHLPGTGDLVADLASFRPTFIAASHRVLERVHAEARRVARAQGRERMFEVAEDIAVAYSMADRASIGLRLRRAAAGLVFQGTLRAVLGGRCVAAITSGPFAPRLTHLFRGAGVPVYAGYGVTETAGPICVNTPEASRVGTVGRAVAAADVRVENGEILVRGEILTDPDGWFPTGAHGAIDPDGYLTITL